METLNTPRVETLSWQIAIHDQKSEVVIRLMILKSWEVKKANLFFYTDSEIVCNVDNNQHSNRELEEQHIKYITNENVLDDLPPQSKDEYFGDPFTMLWKK